jgi:hypothetical protein
LRDIDFPNIGLEYLITHEKARQRRAISLTLLSKLGCGEAQHPILAIGSNNDPAPGRVGLVESKSASFLNDFNGISGETADSRCAYRKSSPSILVMQSTLVIFDEPTRGVDVGAIAEIHELIHRLAEEGLAVIVISSYLPEVLNLSDRILVSQRGRIVEEFSPNEATEERIMFAAVH